MGQRKRWREGERDRPIEERVTIGDVMVNFSYQLDTSENQPGRVSMRNCVCWVSL